MILHNLATKFTGYLLYVKSIYVYTEPRQVGTEQDEKNGTQWFRQGRKAWHQLYCPKFSAKLVLNLCISS